jgi:hypothetical protein
MITQDTTFSPVSKESFTKCLNDQLDSGISLRQAISGKQKEVAAKAQVTHQQVRDALRGRVSEPFVLGVILQAIKMVYNDNIRQYSNMCN